MTQIFRDTIPSYWIHHLPERYNQYQVRSWNLSLDENYQVMKELNLVQKKTLIINEFDPWWIFQKYAKQCKHYLRKTPSPYEYEYSCVACCHNVIKRKNELNKNWRKKNKLYQSIETCLTQNILRSYRLK